MSRALVWKEWRENRAVMLVGNGLVVALPLLTAALVASSSDVTTADVSVDLWSRLVATMIWPVFGALFGATALGAERGAGTLDFVAMRPLSRARLWTTKVAVAAACQMSVMLTSAALLAALDPRAGRAVWRMVFGDWQTAALGAWLLFSSALVASAWTKRPLAAATASAILAAIVVVPAAVISGAVVAFANPGTEVFRGAASVWRGPSMASWFVPIGLVTAGFLSFSFWRFAGSELRQSRTRSVGLVAAVFVVGTLPALAPPVVAQVALTPEWGDVIELTIDPEGSTVLLTVVSPSRRQSQVWRAPLEGGEPRRLSGRWPMAFEPFFSGDGRKVAFFSGSDTRTWGPIQPLDLWMASPDGSEDSELAENLPKYGARSPALEAMFSADSRSIVILRGSALSIVSVEASEVSTIDTREFVGREGYARLIGVSSDGEEVFVAGRRGRGETASYNVVAVNFASPEVRPIARWDSGPFPGWQGIVRLAGAEADQIVVRRAGLWLLDTMDGSLTRVAERSCAEAVGPEVLFYLACERNEGREVVTALHVRKTFLDADESIVPIKDPMTRPVLVPHPSGQRVALGYGRRGAHTIVVFDQEATQLSKVSSALQPWRWTTDGRLVTSLLNASSLVHLLDPNTGKTFQPEYIRHRAK